MMLSKKNNKKGKTKIVTVFVLPKNLDLGLGILYQFGFTTVEQKTIRNKIQLAFSVSSVKEIEALKKISDSKTKDKNEKIFQNLKIKTEKNRSWVNEYHKYLKTFCFVSVKKPECSIWIDPRIKKNSQKNSNTIYLEPGLAFGTGTHPTTQTSAELLAETILKNKKIDLLDLGSGSGILAMVAAKLGVKSIHAIDNDPEAIEVAKKNFIQNGIKNILLKTSLIKVKIKFDLIVANILLPTLLELKPKILSNLKSGGFLILSGLIYKDKKDLLKGYSDLKLIKQKNRKGWSAFLFKKE